MQRRLTKQNRVQILALLLTSCMPRRFMSEPRFLISAKQRTPFGGMWGAFPRQLLLVFTFHSLGVHSSAVTHRCLCPVQELVSHPPPTYERTAWGRAPTWQWAATEFSAVMFSLLDPNVETALELLALTWSMSVCAGATLPPSLKEYIFSTTFWKNALRNAYRQWLTTVFKTPT